MCRALPFTFIVRTGLTFPFPFPHHPKEWHLYQYVFVHLSQELTVVIILRNFEILIESFLLPCANTDYGVPFLSPSMVHVTLENDLNICFRCHKIRI